MIQADYFVFNGDADGLCAQHQLYLKTRLSPALITGVKRDIKLLTQLDTVSMARIVAMDISLGQNLPALEKLLAQGCQVTWFDHHLSRHIPDSPNLKAYIDTSAKTNTSLIVNEFIGREHRQWAIVGLFGDNFFQKAEELAREEGLAPGRTARLREAGELINYNAYGRTIEDLHFDPAGLALKMQPFENPLDFIEQTDILDVLRQGRQDDLGLAFDAEKIGQGLYLLPAERWARRVSGEFANSLARQEPDLAHAVLVDNGQGGYVVSVRSPLASQASAAELCQQFETGGGRITAAGINILPADQLSRFREAFEAHYR